MLYKVNGKHAEKINQTKFKIEKKLEKDLENWIEYDCSILSEKLLIIGRQVQIPEVNDKIDLLALDTNGNVVIIELKKGHLKDPVDIQSMRYASYISRWEFNDLEKQANNYFTERGETDFNFNEKFETFCIEAGIDEIPDLNQEQRIIIAGSKLKEKLGSVALWLREHSIDIKVIEISLYKDNDTLFLDPQTIIPMPTTEKFEIGKFITKKDRPWIKDGKEWHLSKRCGKKIKESLLQFNNIIEENFEKLDGPNWNQKFYVSFKDGPHTWIYVNTCKSNLNFKVWVKRGDMNAEKIAENLGIQVFDSKASLSEKLQLGSSVTIEKRGRYDKVKIRIKEDFNIGSQNFLEFLKNAYKSFKNG